MKKIMAKSIPYGACPYCSHKQFVVVQHQMDLFLTNRDGDIIDGCEISNISIGKCGNCGREMEMLATSYGFIPLTPIRKVVYSCTKDVKPIRIARQLYPSQEHNPMFQKEEEKS